MADEIRTTEADRAYKLRVHAIIQDAIDGLQCLRFGALNRAEAAADPLNREAAKAVHVARNMLFEAEAVLREIKL